MKGRQQIAPGLHWTVETFGILVLPASGSGRLLTGLEAAAWDLATRGNQQSEAVRILSAIGAVCEEDAARALKKWLDGWRNAGWLAEGGTHS